MTQTSPDAPTSPAAERPMRADARRNRERLLRAARDTFAEQGVDGSLEEVARRAGVGVGTLYRHFPARDDLIEALLHERFERTIAHAESLREGGDPWAAVEAYLRDVLSDAATFRGVAASIKATMHDASTPLGTVCALSRQGWSTLLEWARAEGVVRADADADDVLRVVYGIAWAADQRRARRPDSDPRIEPMLRIVLQGLRS
ncbi:TetR/AcrR family transcriptional regulator [Patulibacter medicamentivorans]|nr:TetR/AcrR family transcriptional regulator [Patulibacter medicamentivorans]